MTKKNNKKNIMIVLMTSYFIILIWIILFKLSYSFDSLSRFRNINLIPFFYENNTSFHLKEVIENALIFIPFGLYLKMVKINNKRIILFGFLTSLILETSQYIFKLGGSDITDIITNTTGIVLGIFIYNLFLKKFKNNSKANKILEVLALIATIIFLILFILLFLANS